MLANDANTERIVVETKTAHWWAFTQSNDTNSRMYMATERLAQLHGEDAAAQQFHALYAEQKQEADDSRATAQKLEKDSQHETRKGHWFEFAELALETSIVLCSVALLTELLHFWRLSFVSTGAGILLILTGAWFC
jgi:ferric-dicitrate binding protein FerR (iron transport regulator)